MILLSTVHNVHFISVSSHNSQILGLSHPSGLMKVYLNSIDKFDGGSAYDPRVAPPLLDRVMCLTWMSSCWLGAFVSFSSAVRDGR